MSRSGYSDDYENPLEYGRWRQAVKQSLNGKRGQAFLRELVEALDAMPENVLYPGNFTTAGGAMCALGVVGAKRGIVMDDLGSEGDCDLSMVADRFGIAPAMAAEIMYLNDQYMVDTHKWVRIQICGPMRPYHPDWGDHSRTLNVYNDEHAQTRWKKMREWAVENLKENA